MKRNRCVLFLSLVIAGCGGSSSGSPSPPPPPIDPIPPAVGVPFIISGTADDGTPVNTPGNWPLAAGDWNAKAARYHAGTHRIIFETFREDIRAGSIAAGANVTATGITEYYIAGPNAGAVKESGTTVLYIANADGTSPSCLGCEDMTDGVNDVEVYKVDPSSSSTPNAVVRQSGFSIYANQNKDLAAFHPGGEWVIAAVEFPHHAATHEFANGEVGIFTDLWAISADGKRWVQLTDFASTWENGAYDPVAATPYACLDTPNCPAGCQYVGTAVAPFEAYSCSSPGMPPPPSGVMRPTVSHGLTGSAQQSAQLVWGERVGLLLTYTWAGTLQLSQADVVLQTGIPALVNHRRNLTPSAADPVGQGLWSNPGGDTQVGAGYEPWSFSADDRLIAVATDIFLSSSTNALRSVTNFSQTFTDVGAWEREPTPGAFSNITDYVPGSYEYMDNAGTDPENEYGHWEEPSVYSVGAAVPYIAFGSSADLDPAWNPLDFPGTFGLETWILRLDRATPAIKLTHFNEPNSAPRRLGYPTAHNSQDDLLILTVVPSITAGNPPGAIYAVKVPDL